MSALGKLSLYNTLLQGRTRLPYGESAAWNSVSVMNLNALFASHVIQEPKGANEFRVLLLGDSNTWGWLLPHDATLSTAINQQGLTIGERRVVAYNLGYPELSLTKDLLILSEALQYQPDLIIWLVTLDSLQPNAQLSTALVRNHPQQIRALIETYDLRIDTSEVDWVEPDLWQRTIIGQRRNLADLLRLQTYGIAWSATEVDQLIGEYELRQSDFEADESWGEYAITVELTQADLAFDVLAAGVALSGDVPMLIVNEPIFISNGTNSDIRYNSFYPRWAYDQYRVLLTDRASTNNWRYLDTWDAIAPDEFTDTPVHLTPAGTQQLSLILADWIEQNTD